jgi:hypothetical protein
MRFSAALVEQAALALAPKIEKAGGGGLRPSFPGCGLLTTDY